VKDFYVAWSKGLGRSCLCEAALAPPSCVLWGNGSVWVVSEHGGRLDRLCVSLFFFCVFWWYVGGVVLILDCMLLWPH